MNMIKQTVLVVAALTIILAIVASVMLAATARAEPLTCDGELVQSQAVHGVFIENLLTGEDCEIDKTQVPKVLATCRLNRRCQVSGDASICHGELGCVNWITRVLSVKRPRNDWFIPGGTNQE
jgi:hypothetical protein